MKLRFILATALFFPAIQSILPMAKAGEWPQFRGPSGDGISRASGLPQEFDENTNLLWKTELPGRGWSSPVFDGEFLWLTTAIEVFPTEEERIERLKAAGEEERTFAARQVANQIDLAVLQVNGETGELLQQIDLVTIEEPQTIHAFNSFASPTPYFHEGMLYAHFGAFGTFAIDTDSGKIVWKNDIEVEHGVGPGSSPLVYGDLLILVFDGVDRQFVTALNRYDGTTAWTSYRPEMRAPLGDQKKSYNTPLLITDKDDREQLICMGSQWLVSYDPLTGKEIWRLDHGDGFSVVPRPVFSNEHQLLYFSTGYGKPELLAVKVDGKGDVTNEDKVAWRETRQIPAKPSPLLLGDHLYVISDGGVGTCFDAANGETLWTDRIAGNYTASPLFADGRIYLANQEGVVNVIAPGAEFSLLATNQLEASFMASPITLENSLVLRSDKALYRFATE